MQVKICNMDVLLILYVYPNSFAFDEDFASGGRSGGSESPSRDRLVYLTTCLIGHQVEVQVKSGAVYNGIFHATNADKDFGMFSR